MKNLLNGLLTLAALSLGVAPAAHAHEGAHDTPPKTASSPAPSDHQGAHSGAQGHPAGSTQDHPHAAPHGGFVQSTSKGHLDLVAGRDGLFKLYLLDEKLATQAVTGASATLKLTVPGYADVKLSPVGDHLEGKGAAFQAEHPTAVVSVTMGGATQTARFALHLEQK